MHPLFLGFCSPRSKAAGLLEKISECLTEARKLKQENPEKWNCSEAQILDRLIAIDDLVIALANIQGPGDSSDYFVRMHMQYTIDAYHKVGQLIAQLLLDFSLTKPAMDYSNYGKPIKGAKPEDYAVGKEPDWFGET